jgi:hypothetical protein
MIQYNSPACGEVQASVILYIPAVQMSKTVSRFPFIFKSLVF